MLRFLPTGDRAKPAVASGQLDQSRRAGGVVVGARPDADVVAVGEDDDHVRAGARNDGHEIPQADAPEPWDRLIPGILLGRKPVEGELLLDPLGGTRSAGCTGSAIGKVAGELRRKHRCDVAVEGGGKCRCREGPGSRDREREEGERQGQEHAGVADEPGVDRAVLGPVAASPARPRANGPA